MNDNTIIDKNNYALLDTDFISKTFHIQSYKSKRLIDEVLKLQGYKFICHNQIKIEIECYGGELLDWLNNRIIEKKIICYTDEDIIKSLYENNDSMSCMMYLDFLKVACDAFSKNYFNKNYYGLENLDYINIKMSEYTGILKSLDDAIGKDNNLGEIKTYILLQALSFNFKNNILYFCSDDKSARNGTQYINNVNCISLISLFLHLKNELSWTFDKATPYINSLIEFYKKYNQEYVGVVESIDNKRICRVLYKQVFDDIFKDKFIELKNGMLCYKK